MSWNLFSLHLIFFFFLVIFSILHGPSNIFDFTADAALKSQETLPGWMERRHETRRCGEKALSSKFKEAFSDKAYWAVSVTG